MPRFDTRHLYLILLGFDLSLRHGHHCNLTRVCRTLHIILQISVFTQPPWSFVLPLHICISHLIKPIVSITFLWHYVLVFGTFTETLSICCSYLLIGLSASSVVSVFYHVCFVSAITLIVFCCSLTLYHPFISY